MNSLIGVLLWTVCAATPTLEPIPDRLVVLTFDDSSKSQFTVARPVLMKHKFGATFFITEGFDFPTNKADYMTWDEIVQLHQDGFEIGNHTMDHGPVTERTMAQAVKAIKTLNERFGERGIPQPVSFAYPGNAFEVKALPLLKEQGLLFARRGGSPEYAYEIGGGIPYEPGLDHPLLIPTTGDARPTWTLDNLKAEVAQARGGRIVVLQFHGVPDTAHSWVSTREQNFTQFMQYLADEKFTVIAMRDLAKYVDPAVVPSDPLGVIEDRKRLIAAKQDGSNARPAPRDEDLQFWLPNMLIEHRYSFAEAGAALGLTADEVRNAAHRLSIPLNMQNDRSSSRALTVRPYPGGRHPRTGFRDGAIRPQRETKFSLFAPWDDGGYAVADVPEAVWFQADGKPELLYLAHAHVPTIWEKQSIPLKQLEWEVGTTEDSLTLVRELPNHVTLTSSVHPERDCVRMEFKVTNGSDKLLSGLRVQMCVMLARLTGFEQQTNDNKVFSSPFAACRQAGSNRWIITGWERCGRAWGNPPCPCLHADPVVEDCPPGKSKRVRGWLSFYIGDQIDTELRRLAPIAFP